MIRKVSLAVVVVLLAAEVVLASWYDDYEAGIKAYRQHQWAVVVQKMSAAIKGNPKEDDHARTYGAIFITYHPYYYRALANLYLGNYEAAKSDLERASGPGEINEGTIETLMDRVNAKIAAANVPEPQPAPVTPQPRPPVPVPQPQPAPVPAGPVVDSALRQRAQTALNTAKTHLTAAQQRKATASPQYGQALQAYTAANSQLAAAKSNDDLNAVLASADNVVLLADSAMPPSVPQPPPTGPGGKPLPPVFDQYQPQLRRAFKNYYEGEFELAASDFKSLATKLPTNGWIWAFLGASQYSLYAFEADETYRAAALQSFRRAKQLRSWKNGLPEKYFSKRIRRVFENAG